MLAGFAFCLFAAFANWGHCSRRDGLSHAVRRPCVHELRTLVEIVATLIGSLGRVIVRMRECGLGNLSRDIGLFRRSIAKRRTKTVRRNVGALDAF